MKLSSVSKAVLLALLAMGLNACGNVSHNVARDGSSAGKLIWPRPDEVTPMHHGGTFPEPPDLREVQAGLNKQQIAHLIGWPHFLEGVWGVREWNYLFNFRDSSSGRVTVCQFKILFDENMRARSFYWKPTDCARFAASPPSQPPATPTATTEQETTLSADTLFAFGRHSLAGMTDGGRAQLDRLAGQLHAEQDRIVDIVVTGYTDRLGGDGYNRTLSQRRARTVAEYLAAKGVSGALLRTDGYGKADPVVRCANQARSQLIACLAPNRRVVVRVELHASR